MAKFLKGIIWVMLIIIIIFFAIKYLLPSFVEKNQQTIYNFNPDELRAQTKIVIWEQDFTLNFTERKTKKYFKSDWLKFTESIATSAKGKMGFHIDLSDTTNTIIDFKNDTVVINTPLELTYVQIDLGTIEMIKKASIDPSLNVSKDSIIHKLDQRAIEQFLQPTISTIKLKSLNEQERFLSRLTNKPVRISYNKVPLIKETINKWWSKQ